MLLNTIPILEKIGGIIMKTGDEQVLFDTQTGEVEVIESVKCTPVPYIRIEVINSDDNWQP